MHETDLQIYIYIYIHTYKILDQIIKDYQNWELKFEI